MTLSNSTIVSGYPSSLAVGRQIIRPIELSSEARPFWHKGAKESYLVY